ncbi:hypothetical protein [Ectothiorhodospira shaposhnikovii]|uniref:hypothetical protein n=1 Tax=Ectothiorhodospira shaposhnikovii TaxID=1054 RepID=UPI001EE87986|nr:hypothetical protein [Ectothiorhodospira shaposhnikovii]MCG5512779.1 hypothetical protein [Ectothiorhodospira shaposhnikovii]
MSEVSLYRPGCFGSIISFSPSNVLCAGCPCSADCGEQASQTLRAIRAEEGIAVPESPAAKTRKAEKPVTPRTRATGLDADSQRVLERITAKKPAEYAERLLRQGFTCEVMGLNLRKRQNPFAIKGPKYMRIIIDGLIDGGLSKNDLATLYMQSGMSKATAYSHVSIAIHFLLAMDLISESDGRFVLTGG